MNWKENLKELLSYRNENSFERVKMFLKVQNEIVLPVFKEIDRILTEHQLFCAIDNSNCTLKVENYGFIMSTDLEENNIKFTFKFLNPIDPELVDYKEYTYILVPLEEVSNELIGNQFYNEFKKAILYFNRNS